MQVTGSAGAHSFGVSKTRENRNRPFGHQRPDGGYADEQLFTTADGHVNVMLTGFETIEPEQQPQQSISLYNHPVASRPNPLAAEGRERNARMGLENFRLGAANVTVSGQYFEFATPETEHLTGFAFTDGRLAEENQVARVETQIGLMNDRLRYQGGMARSKYYGPGLPTYDDGGNFADSVTSSARVDGAAESSLAKGNEWWHRIDADLFVAADVTLSTYGELSQVDPLFYTVEFDHAGERPVGRQQEVGVDIDVGSLSTSLWRRELESVDMNDQEYGARFDGGLAAVQVMQSRVVNLASPFGLEDDLTFWGDIGFDDDWAYLGSTGPRWDSREETVEGEIELRTGEVFSLGQIGGGADSIGVLLPYSVTLRGSRTRIAYPDEYDGTTDPEDVRKGFELELFWQSDISSTIITYAQFRTDSRQLWMESADFVERTIDISQDFYFDKWELSAYLSLGRSNGLEIDNRSVDLMISSGASFSYQPDAWPKLTLNLDLDRYDSQYLDYGESFRNDGWAAGLELDFSSFLATSDRSGSGLLKLGYRTEGTHDRDTYLGSDTHTRHGFYILGGYSF